MTYQLHNLNVLIVEDMPPMLELTRNILENFGFTEIHTASDGDTGFEAFQYYRPDLVITDWAMEPTDGLDLTWHIRSSPKSFNIQTPIIMMTGFSHKMRVEKARDTGITEFIAKPFTAKDLYNRIETVIERPRQFVLTNSFLGPDRRRRSDRDYQGPPRRATDKPNIDLDDSQDDILLELRDSTQKNT